MAILKNITALFFFLLFSSNAYADHPLITDDTGTQGKGKFQIEVNSAFATNKTIVNVKTLEKRDCETAATLSGGIADAVDLVVGMPWQSHTIREDGMISADEQGIGDMRVEVKWRFFKSEDNGMSFALKPGILIPSGSEKKGLGNGALSGGVTMIATHEGRLGTLHGNIGYTRNQYGMMNDKNTLRTNIWNASLAAELNVLEKLRSVLNIGIETNNNMTSQSNPAFLLGGLIYSASEKLDLDIGVKGGLNDVAPDTALLVGLTARF